MAVATGRRKYFYGATRKEVQAQLRKAQQEQMEGRLLTAPSQTAFCMQARKDQLRMEGRLLTAPSQTLESFLVFWQRQADQKRANWLTLLKPWRAFLYSGSLSRNTQ